MDTGKQQIGNTGVFLVAAQLSKMGYLALLTTRNSKGPDIVVYSIETNRGRGLQIKTSREGSFPICQSTLTDYLEVIDKKVSSDYVFVDISNDEDHLFFPVLRDKVKAITRDSIENYINFSNHKTSIQKMKEKGGKHNWVLNREEIQIFNGQWENVLGDL